MKHWKCRKSKIVPVFKGIFRKMEDKVTNNYSMQKKKKNRVLFEGLLEDRYWVLFISITLLSAMPNTML